MFPSSIKSLKTSAMNLANMDGLLENPKGNQGIQFDIEKKRLFRKTLFNR